MPKRKTAVLQNGLNGKESTVEIRPVPHTHKSLVFVKKEEENMNAYDSEKTSKNQATNTPKVTTTEAADQEGRARRRQIEKRQARKGKT